MKVSSMPSIRWSVFVMLAIIVLILAGCSVTLPEVALPVSATPGEPWVLFCDPAAQCTFHYPPDADFRAGKSKFGIHTIRLQFRMPDAAGYQGMVIRIVPISESYGLQDVLAEIYASSPQDLPLEEWLTRLEPTSVGGQAGLKTLCGGGSSDFSIVIPGEDRIYVASMEHDPLTICADPKTVEVFHQVLETFMLTQDGSDQ